jgi:hypothetical protein
MLPKTSATDQTKTSAMCKLKRATTVAANKRSARQSPAWAPALFERFRKLLVMRRIQKA